MKLFDSASAHVPSAAPSSEIRRLSELHEIHNMLARITEMLAQISEKLDRAANSH